MRWVQWFTAGGVARLAGMPHDWSTQRLAKEYEEAFRQAVEQQALQGMRTSRINALRGFCREFGIAIPVGARTGIEAISRVLADPSTAVPKLIWGTAKLLIEEIRLLEARIAQLERELAALVKLSPACTTLLSIPNLSSG